MSTSTLSDKVINVVFFLLILGLIAYGIKFFLGGSHWYVSDPEVHTLLKEFSIKDLFHLDQSWIHSPNITRVNKLTVSNIPANLFSLFVMAATFIPMMVILYVILVVGTISEGNSGEYWKLALMLVGVIFFVTAFPFVVWARMLIQPATVGYYIVWGLLGLPVILGGIGSNVAGGHCVIIIFSD
ncbi:MAG TPA: hypothetical protein PLC24_08885 [Myxococcota bacterium]|nr:hypothetical protein [Myxococcota bacterium]